MKIFCTALVSLAFAASSYGQGPVRIFQPAGGTGVYSVATNWSAATLEDASMVFQNVPTDGAGRLVVSITQLGGNAFLNAVVLETSDPTRGTFLMVR